MSAPGDHLRWRRPSLDAAWEVVTRGGRRQLLTSRLPFLAATQGLRDGVAYRSAPDHASSSCRLVRCTSHGCCLVALLPCSRVTTLENTEPLVLSSVCDRPLDQCALSLDIPGRAPSSHCELRLEKRQHVRTQARRESTTAPGQHRYRCPICLAADLPTVGGHLATGVWLFGGA